MNKIICLLSLIIIVISIFCLFSEVNNRIRIAYNEVRTTGRVIYTEYDSSTDSCESIIEYHDETGKRYELYTSAGYEKWSHIEIQYEKGNPTNAFTLDFYGSWFMSIFKILFLTLFATILANELKKEIQKKYLT